MFGWSHATQATRAPSGDDRRAGDEVGPRPQHRPGVVAGAVEVEEDELVRGLRCRGSGPRARRGRARRGGRDRRSATDPRASAARARPTRGRAGAGARRRGGRRRRPRLATAYEPPPYSWTRVRTDHGAGRTSCGARAVVADEDDAPRLGRAQLEPPGARAVGTDLVEPHLPGHEGLRRDGEGQVPWGRTLMARPYGRDTGPCGEGAAGRSGPVVGWPGEQHTDGLRGPLGGGAGRGAAPRRPRGGRRVRPRGRPDGGRPPRLQHDLRRRHPRRSPGRPAGRHELQEHPRRTSWPSSRGSGRSPSRPTSSSPTRCAPREGSGSSPVDPRRRSGATSSSPGRRGSRGRTPGRGRPSGRTRSGGPWRPSTARPRGGPSPPAAELPRFDAPLFGDEDVLTPAAGVVPGPRRSSPRRPSARRRRSPPSTPGSPIPLHADLHGGNLKWHEGRLAVFDFDDSGIGVPLLDLAISTFYLRRRGPTASRPCRRATPRSRPCRRASTSTSSRSSRPGSSCSPTASSTPRRPRCGRRPKEYVHVTLARLRHWLDTGHFVLDPG